MQLKYLPTFNGIVKDYHPRLIPEDKLSDGTNIVFSEGRVCRRHGYTRLGTNQLNGSLTALAWYEQLGTATKYLVALTTRDAYYYDSASTSWKYITKQYNTGSAECTSSTVSLTGTAASWSTSWPTSVCQISFDSNDPNSCTTWHTVSSFSNTTTATITDTATASSGPYVIRLCYSGDADTPHSVAMPIASDVRIVCAANGVDSIRKWNGSGAMTDLGGTPNVARYLGYFGSVGAEHLLLGWTIDSISAADQPQTIEYSVAGDPEDFSDGEYDDLYNTNDQIKGFKALGDHIVCYKEHSLSVMWPTGSTVPIFNIKQNAIASTGTPSINTVCDFGNYHIFLGDDDIYKFDGINLHPIGSAVINSILSDVNPTALLRSFAMPVYEESLYCLFIPTVSEYPDRVYVYDYAGDTWSIWELGNEMTCWGYWYNDSSETWSTLDSSGEVWTDYDDETWIDMLSYGGSKTYVLGDKDGYVYEFLTTANTDNGTVITADFTTRDYPLNDTKQLFKLLECTVGLVRETLGQIQIRASVNFGEQWSEWRPIYMNGGADYMERTASFLMRGKQVRFNIRNINGVDFELESLGVGFNNAGV